MEGRQHVPGLSMDLLQSKYVRPIRIVRVSKDLTFQIVEKCMNCQNNDSIKSVAAVKNNNEANIMLYYTIRKFSLDS